MQPTKICGSPNVQDVLLNHQSLSPQTPSVLMPILVPLSLNTAFSSTTLSLANWPVIKVQGLHQRNSDKTAHTSPHSQITWFNYVLHCYLVPFYSRNKNELSKMVLFSDMSNTQWVISATKHAFDFLFTKQKYNFLVVVCSDGKCISYILTICWKHFIFRKTRNLLWCLKHLWRKARSKQIQTTKPFLFQGFRFSMSDSHSWH